MQDYSIKTRAAMIWICEKCGNEIRPGEEYYRTVKNWGEKSISICDTCHHKMLAMPPGTPSKYNLTGDRKEN